MAAYPRSTISSTGQKPLFTLRSGSRFFTGSRLQMSRNAGTGRFCTGMNAVNTKLPSPHLPPYVQRMRLRSAFPSTINLSGSAGSKRSEAGWSAPSGRRPYIWLKNFSSSSGRRTPSHSSTVFTGLPPNVVISGGTLRGAPLNGKSWNGATSSMGLPAIVSGARPSAHRSPKVSSPPDVVPVGSLRPTYGALNRYIPFAPSL